MTPFPVLLDVVMRTTLTIDDKVAEALKETAHITGKPFKAIVNEMLQLGSMAREQLPKSRPYRLTPVSLSGVMPGVNLDKALALADAIEPDQR